MKTDDRSYPCDCFKIFFLRGYKPHCPMFQQRLREDQSIVKGARSKRSPKSAQFQPLSYVDVIYRNKPNRELQVLSKVNFRESWPRILQDLRSVTLSMAILEMTEKTLSEEDPHPGLFNTLADVLRAVSYTHLTLPTSDLV